MNLLEKIDNELRLLNESIDPKKEQEIVNLAKAKDPGINGSTLKGIWGPKDSKWNSLIDPVMSNDKKLYVVKLRNAVDKVSKNAISDNNLYVNWTGNLITDNELENAYLTNINNATRIDDNFLDKDERKKIIDALNKDENSKNIKYDDINCVELKLKNTDYVTLSDLIEYYYSIATNGGDINDYSDYWKRAVQISVGSTKNIISNDIMQLLIKARNNLDLFDCLKTKKLASQTIYSLLDSSASRYDMNVDQIINYKKYFLLSLLVYGCYDNSGFKNVGDVIQSFAIFDKIKKDYEYGQLALKYNLEDILQGNNLKEKADTLAQNVLTYKDNIDNNPFVEILGYDKPDEEVKERAISDDTINKLLSNDKVSDEIKTIKICKVTEVKAILDDIVDETNTEHNKHFLIVGNNKYQLLPSNNQLKPKDKKIFFEGKSPIIIAYGLSSSLDEKDNQFVGLTEVDKAVEFSFSTKDTTYNINDYFEVKDGLLVTRTPFILETKSESDNLFYFDMKAMKLVITTAPRAATEEDKEEAKEQEKVQNNPTKESKLDDETRTKLQEAIINYLKLHKTKLLPNDNQIEKFIRTPQSANYEKLKELVLQQLFERPDIYYYNKDTNEIGNIENTYMSMLFDILNNNLDSAKEKMNHITSHNISPYIDIQYGKLRAPKLTSQDVANKLDILSNLLKQDATYATNKIDTDIKRELNKPENKQNLADLIAWFNSRLAPKNSVNIEKPKDSKNPSETA